MPSSSHLYNNSNFIQDKVKVKKRDRMDLSNKEKQKCDTIEIEKSVVYF